MTFNDFANSFRRAGLASECRLADFINDASKRFSRNQIRAVLMDLEDAGLIQIEDPPTGPVIVRTESVAECCSVADVLG